MGTSHYFKPDQQRQIVEAIKNAELITSGEIRVHIESICNENVLDRTAWIFKKLKMQKTKLRNGVLIYVAIQSKKFAIIGDVGINTLVPENFWDTIKVDMQKKFSTGDFLDAILIGIKESGIALEQYFPYDNENVDEQPDEISFGK